MPCRAAQALVRSKSQTFQLRENRLAAAQEPHYPPPNDAQARMSISLSHEVGPKLMFKKRQAMWGV